MFNFEQRYKHNELLHLHEAFIYSAVVKTYCLAYQISETPTFSLCVWQLIYQAAASATQTKQQFLLFCLHTAVA